MTLAGLVLPATFTTEEEGGGYESHGDRGGPVTPVRTQFTRFVITQPVYQTAQEYELIPGKAIGLRWLYQGSIPWVNVLVSYDQGATYEEILHRRSVESFSWDIPSEARGKMRFRLEGTDGAAIVATYTSQDFVLVPSVIPQEETQENTDHQNPVSEEDEVQTFFKSPDLPTVYLIDNAGVRHPFLSAQTYFTWADSFGEIRIVETTDLSQYPLGSPILPRAGRVLLKIQSDPKVYGVFSTPGQPWRPTLRAIPDEETAIALFGEDWSEYVIDVEPTFFRWFFFDEPLDEHDTVTTRYLRSRISLTLRMQAGE